MHRPIDKSDEEALLAAHDRNVAVVRDAVAGLVPQFAANGLTPAACFEGAIKGATAVMIALNDCSASDVADMLEEIAQALRHPNQPDLRIVK